ncbi:UNVERIFIED_CONTAM: hypothetical protein GTU68_006172 [Idotea baltica]|nr:hypothetical protein [Idotea baltica]
MPRKSQKTTWKRSLGSLTRIPFVDPAIWLSNSTSLTQP